MNYFDKIRNYRLRWKEKSGNSFFRPVWRGIGVLSRHPRRVMSQGTLKVMIGITYQCQCSCEYCCSAEYPLRPQDELTTAEGIQLLEDIRRMPYAAILVSFFGGEPLLRKDLFTLIQNAVRKGLITELETNGILLNRGNVLRLKKSGLHHVFVRIEHSDPQIHDRISHYEGCFMNAIEGLRHCLTAKLSCSISVVATKEKIHGDQIRRIIELAKKIGVVSVRIVYPTLSGRWVHAYEKVLTSEEEKIVRSLLKPDFVYLESSHVCTPERNRICPAHEKKMFYVSCYGDVQPCPFVPVVFGNIRRNVLAEIVDNMWGEAQFAGGKSVACLMHHPDFRDAYLCEQCSCGTGETP